MESPEFFVWSHGMSRCDAIVVTLCSRMTCSLLFVGCIPIIELGLLNIDALETCVRKKLLIQRLLSP